MGRRYAVAVLFALFAASPLVAQKTSEKASGIPAKKSTAIVSTSAYLDALLKNTTTAGRVALAEAAGPTAIARHALIVEIPSPPEAKTLRAGNNGWTCIADRTGPVCADATAMAFISAMMNKLTPQVDKVGIAYKLVGEKAGAGPYIMIVGPSSMLAGFKDNAASGEPYVKDKGTPYAHVVVPLK